MSWANPTATLVMGAKTRVGYGGRDTGAYLGSGAVTITAGVNASHWQWDSVNKCPVPKNGSAASGSAWVASPDATYVITATETATGDTCVYTITVPAGTAHVSTSWAQGQGTHNNSPRGTLIYWAAGVYDTGANRNLARLGGGTGSWTGSNWTIWRPIPGYEGQVTIQNVLCGAGNTYGVKIFDMVLEDTNPTNASASGAFQFLAGVNRAFWIEDCHFSGATAYAANREARGLFGRCADITIRNVTADKCAYICGAGIRLEGLDIDGLHVTGFTNDALQLTADAGDANCNGRIRNLFVQDSLVPAVTGAHPDFIQIISTGTTGATLSGTFVIEQFVYALGTGQFLCSFIMGRSANGIDTNPARLANMIVRRGLSIGISANNFLCNLDVDNLSIENFLSTTDIGNPVATNPSIINIGSTVVNVTVKNCVATNIALNNTGTRINQNNLTSQDSAAEQNAIFFDPYTGTGGTSVHGDWSTIALVEADIGRRYAPNGSALDNADGSKKGPLFPYDGGIQWNNGGIYATRCTLAASPTSTAEGGSITLTATLKNCEDDAVRGSDVTVTLDQGGSAGNSGAQQIVIPEGQSSASIAVADAGTSTGSWTFAADGLSNPSAFSVRVA